MGLTAMILVMLLQVYWISYSHLKDKSMFSWADHEVFEEL